MKLTVLERLMIQNLLPEKGSFTNLKLVRVAREALSFDELENKRLNFQQDGEQLRWNEDSVGEKEIPIGEIVTEIIKKSLRDLDQKEELTVQQTSIFEKFLG